LSRVNPVDALPVSSASIKPLLIHFFLKRAERLRDQR
jgi:hypothetical protein